MPFQTTNPYLQGKHLKLSIFLHTFGMIAIALGVVLTLYSRFGAGGYDAMNLAFSQLTGMPINVIIYLVALLFTLGAGILRRQSPQWASFLSSFVIGTFVAVWKYLLQGIQPESLLSQIAIFLSGMTMISVGVGTYLLSHLPANPVDDFVLAIHERGLPLFLSKLLFDVSCFLIAFFLKGNLGIGTLIITLCLGPMIAIWKKILQQFFRRFGIER